MDKEALLNIILSDLREVETLVTSFQGKNEIAEAFVSLAERKLSHISEELTLLRTFSNAKQEQVISQPPVVEQPPVSNQSDFTVPVEKVVANNYIEEVIKEPVTQPAPPSQKPDSTVSHPEPVIPESIQPTVPEPPIVNYSNKEYGTDTSRETPKEAKILGESFMADKKSVNDIIASGKSDVKRTLIGKPVQDLTKGLGINDRFLFQRELFSGNSELMSQTLQQLNDIPDYNSAAAFITSNFDWDFETETTQSFMNYIKRKF